MKVVHVAVGVIEKNGNILLAKRANHQHQGGLWEFPGGKVEPKEDVQQALVRELQEELAITATVTSPLIQIRHDYGDKWVLLDVWLVTDFSGEPKGCEGQPLEWVRRNDLHRYAFPAANVPIVDALILPEAIAISPSAGDASAVLAHCQQALAQGAEALQLRSPQLSASDYWQVFNELHEMPAQVIVNSERLINNGQLEFPVGRELKAIHVKSHHISYVSQLFAHAQWIFAACHSPAELKKAQDAGVTAVLVSPVQATESHPEQESLGWSTFSEWVEACNVPVYALGGVGPQDIPRVRKYYGQGIAGISGFRK